MQQRGVLMDKKIQRYRENRSFDDVSSESFLYRSLSIPPLRQTLASVLRGYFQSTVT